jgi:UDP-N-acetylglucosamine 4-epimerase
MNNADIVLHQAALASVPRSMADPMSTHMANVDGFVNVLLAARASGVQRVVFASSSSVYGDETTEPKREERIGKPLSPYATTKLIDEIYADTFRRTHGIESVGLRYFNVFGPRQDPRGAYASVIPRWTDQLLGGGRCEVYGDGSASRDFCYIDNVVQANLLAACAPTSSIRAGIYNVGYGERTTLLELFSAIRHRLTAFDPALAASTLQTAPLRPGDIPHSLASIDRIQHDLGYRPAFDISRGLDETVTWYAKRAKTVSPPAHTKPAVKAKPGIAVSAPAPQIEVDA